MLKDKVSVGVLPGVLTRSGDFFEDGVHVRHVEVPAQGEVTCPPVIAAQKRMDVRKPRLARRAVSEVSHIQFGGKRQVSLRELRIAEALGRYSLVMAIHRVENLGDRVGACRPLAKHVFFAGGSLELDAGETRSVLSAVMLFLHEEIKFVERIHPCAVFAVIVFERLEQPYHCYAALVF